jgi:DNA-binding LacI/PurR family transcriptional regulator
MAATIKDIARRLNISTSTVSYALNGGPRTVPIEVKERVLAVARELEYRPNRIARSLVTGRTNTIGVVPPAIGENVFLSPFVRSAWNALVNAAAPMGQDLLLYAGHDRNLPDEQGQELLDGRIDGIVFIAPRPDAGATRFVHARGFPFASVSGSIGLSYSSDNDGGVLQALLHLRDLGHRRVAHATGSLDTVDGTARRDSFVRHSANLGFDRDPDLISPGLFTIESGREQARALLNLPKPPTAVFMGNDEAAYGFVLEAREMGFRCPEDVSVIGYDDLASNTVLTPALTSVRQPVDSMAQAALRAVARLVEGGDLPKSRVFPTELIVRASTASPRRQG